MNLPEWLPSSLVLASPMRSTEILVEYILIAEFVPKLVTDYMDILYCPPPHKMDIRTNTQWGGTNIRLSKLNTARFIHIVRPWKDLVI
jgi:hypothetical protein